MIVLFGEQPGWPDDAWGRDGMHSGYGLYVDEVDKVDIERTWKLYQHGQNNIYLTSAK